MSIELLFLFYSALSLMAFVVTIALTLAPLKLYQITRELKTLNETMQVHARLLAAIANATNPVDVSSQGKKAPQD